MAKNIVAAGLAKKCTIQLSYAIGIAEPLSLYVDTHGTGTVDEARLEAVLPKLLRLTPKGIRTHLGRSEEHTSELQSLMRISYAVFCLKKNKYNKNINISKKQIN